MPARSTPKPAAGPSGGPPGRTGPSRDSPPMRTGPTGKPGGPSTGPPGGAKPPQSTPVAKRTPVQQSVGIEDSDSATPQKKVRKARIEVDMSLFEDWQVDDRDAAVSWVLDELSAGEQERTLLMQLQGTGWSAQQSRAIYDMARNQQ